MPRRASGGSLMRRAGAGVMDAAARGVASGSEGADRTMGLSPGEDIQHEMSIYTAGKKSLILDQRLQALIQSWADKIMKIYRCLDDDISEGFVWLKRSGLTSRSVVKITNPTADRSVFCEALQLENNFLREYNKSPRVTIDSPDLAIVMSAWYRARLGNLETQQDYNLTIKPANGCWGKLRSCMQHPQIVIRIAVWLGVISVALGVVGVVLGIVSVWPTR